MLFFENSKFMGCTSSIRTEIISVDGDVPLTAAVGKWPLNRFSNLKKISTKNNNI